MKLFVSYHRPKRGCPKILKKFTPLLLPICTVATAVITMCGSGLGATGNQFYGFL